MVQDSEEKLMKIKNTPENRNKMSLQGVSKLSLQMWWRGAILQQRSK